MDVRVDMSEVHALVRRFPQVAPAARDATATAIRRVVIEGEGRVKRRVSRDTSHYARSITHDVYQRPTVIVGVFGSNVPYAQAREFGRRPGKMPPKGVLLGWMRRHGIDAGLEFPIRRKIGRKGIPGEHVFRDVVGELGPVAIREIRRIKPAILAALSGTSGGGP